MADMSQNLSQDPVVILSQPEEQQSPPLFTPPLAPKTASPDRANTVNSLKNRKQQTPVKDTQKQIETVTKGGKKRIQPVLMQRL
jgi:HIRA B motif